MHKQSDKDRVLLNNIESNKRNSEQLKFVYQNYSRVHRNLDNGVIYGDSSSKCGGTFKSVQTTIQSPDYPNEYQPNSYCEYVFKSPFVCKNEFHIQFLFFSLESSKDCVKVKTFVRLTIHLFAIYLNVENSPTYQSLME